MKKSKKSATKSKSTKAAKVAKIKASKTELAGFGGLLKMKFNTALNWLAPLPGHTDQMDSSGDAQTLLFT